MKDKNNNHNDCMKRCDTFSLSNWIYIAVIRLRHAFSIQQFQIDCFHTISEFFQVSIRIEEATGLATAAWSHERFWIKIFFICCCSDDSEEIFIPNLLPKSSESPDINLYLALMYLDRCCFVCPMLFSAWIKGYCSGIVN